MFPWDTSYLRKSKVLKKGTPLLKMSKIDQIEGFEKGTPLLKMSKIDRIEGFEKGTPY